MFPEFGMFPSPTERLAATRNTIWRAFILGNVRRQCPLPTSTSLYIMCGTLVRHCQLFTRHVFTHAPKCTRTLHELTCTWSFGSAEIMVTLRNRGTENITKKTTLDVTLYVLRLQKMQRKQRCIPATEIGITPSNLPGDRTNTPDAKMDKDTF